MVLILVCDAVYVFGFKKVGVFHRSAERLSEKRIDRLGVSMGYLTRLRFARHPGTYLIDKSGKVAASYIGQIVHKENAQANL